MTGTKMIDGLKPKQRSFLAAYRVGLSLSRASLASSVSLSLHYKWLANSEDYRAAFMASHEDATENLEAEAIRRAMDGESKVVTYKGQPVFVWVDDDDEIVPPNRVNEKKHRQVVLKETTRSDAMLALLLKAKAPEKYKDRTATEHTGANGGPIQSEIRLQVIEDGNWYGNESRLSAESDGSSAGNLAEPGKV